jgi:hypothetical protein
MILCAALCFFSAAVFAAPSPLEGRWDLVVKDGTKEMPSWLEVQHSGNNTLVGRFVSMSGSARPVAEVTVRENQFNFTIPPQWERGDGDLRMEGTFDSSRMSGAITYPDGKRFDFTGTRAPRLKRSAPPVWGQPITLFDGKTLNGWHALGTNQWVAENGILRSPKSGSNLVTDKSFEDFKLHIECRYPKGSNSGVYLRGRYEVQVSDSYGMEPLIGEFGAVYGFITPAEQAAKKPGEWQTYDITLVGRMVTVVANGKTIICNQEIPGITGGALDSKEEMPGPLQLQGDHGPVEYRNIVITPAK